MTLFENDEKRYKEYVKGIETLRRYLKKNNLPIQIILVENSNSIKTPQKLSFLQKFNLPVVLTDANDKINTKNRGRKELYDLINTLDQCQIPDDAFVVKLTGRYVVDETNCPFFKEIENVSNLFALYKSGYFEDKHDEDSCCTGLIGSESRIIKNIYFQRENESLEQSWRRAIKERETMENQQKHARKIPLLGIHCHVAGFDNKYYFQ